MKILAIETSCDETSASIVENNSNGGINILSNVVASSLEIHSKTGGIIPEQAARAQIKYIIPVLEEVFKKANITKEQIDYLAVTNGPGLIGSLLVGVETARTISYLWNKPLIQVNHLVGHVYANWINMTIPQFPAVAMVVSGGHTDLILMRSHNDVKYLGATRDDAAGEAFDKCARLLGLGYPGGPAISKAAESENIEDLNYFPRPMKETQDYDFSFSGLKTAVLREVNSQSKYSRNRLAAETQEAIVDVLAFKINRAVEEYHPKSFLLSGGVAANKRLREEIAKRIAGKTEVFIPPFSLCTDNAAYIGACAYYHKNIVSWEKIEADPSLTITD